MEQTRQLYGVSIKVPEGCPTDTTCRSLTETEVAARELPKFDLKVTPDLGYELTDFRFGFRKLLTPQCPMNRSPLRPGENSHHAAMIVGPGHGLTREPSPADGFKFRHGVRSHYGGPS